MTPKQGEPIIAILDKFRLNFVAAFSSLTNHENKVEES